MVVTFLTYSYTLITVALLYFFLRKSISQKESLKKNIVRWGLFGFIFNFLSLSVIYTAYPLTWMDKGLLQILSIFIFHTIISLVAGISYGVVGFSFKIKKLPSFFNPFIFASFIVLAEILRSFLLSLINYGEGTTLGLHFTLGTIGNALSSTPFIEYAYFGGTFALTFILGYLVYIFSSRNTIKTYWGHGAGIVLILICIHYLLPTYGPQQATTVGIITTDFKSMNDDEAITILTESNIRLEEMTRSLTSSSLDIIVYPEDTRFLSLLTNKNRENIFSLFPKTLFIDGDTSKVNSDLVNVSLFYDVPSQKAQKRGKRFLFPFNEYLPFFFVPIANTLAPKTTKEEYLTNHTFTPIYSDMTIPFKDLRVGTLICSEIISFDTLQKLKEEKTSIVFFQSRLEVFHNNPLFIMHLNSFTKIAAAQLRRPLISASNGAPSLIVSPYGDIIQTLPAGFNTEVYTFSK